MPLSHAAWIALAAVTSLLASWYGVGAIHLWLRSRVLLGPISTEVKKTLRQLLNVSRQGERLKLTRVILLYIGIGAFVVAIAAREWLGLVASVAPFVLIAWMSVRSTTAPVTLILGTSTYSSIRRQHAIMRRLSPFRVVSLLDVDVPWDKPLANKMALDCFRTTNEDDWWLVITKLMEITPILTIDAAAETAGVIRECRHILSTNLWRKCVFLTPPDGSAPILDHLLPMPGVQPRNLQMVCYEEAADVIAAKVAQFGQRRAGSRLLE
jgi:hypothetical protein